MSYYKLFCEYSTQSAFTSNTKFLDINASIYNTKINEINEDIEDDSDNNKEEPKPPVKVSTDINSCKCSV